MWMAWPRCGRSQDFRLFAGTEAEKRLITGRWTLEVLLGVTDGQAERSCRDQPSWTIKGVGTRGNNMKQLWMGMV